MTYARNQLRVQLQQFEGPLDLLLYLIRKEEMDIFNINVVEITKQYLDYIKLMKEFDIEVAGDFIAMAATLIHIKSKMLLPQYNDSGEIIDQEDPRKVLVQKLLEYEKYKEAGKALYERPLLNRDLWARGFREKIEVSDNEIELEDNALFSLIGSFRRTMKSMYKRVHKVNIKLQSIASRIMEMKSKLIVGKQISMSELFNQTLTDAKEKARNILITFLSLLELGKMELVSIYQTENYGEIYINTKKVIDDDVVSKAENYDSINADQIVQSMTRKANKITADEFLETDNETYIDMSKKNDYITDQSVNQFRSESELVLNFDEESNTEIEAATDEDILQAEIEENGQV